MNMDRLLKTVAREITPPFMFRGMRSLVDALFPRVASKSGNETWGERPPEWYDAIYENSEGYSTHYTDSVYYFFWTVIADRMKREGIDNLLDLGCGPGQFAALLYDQGFRKYCGVDFSCRCIEMAKERCDTFEFVVADVVQTDILESRNYDCLIAMEFLEHVKDDLAILKRVKSGTKFFGTVPDFPYPSHVRHFLNSKEVERRYGAFFSSFSVDSFLRDPDGPVFFLLEGTKI